MRKTILDDMWRDYEVTGRFDRLDDDMLGSELIDQGLGKSGLPFSRSSGNQYALSRSEQIVDELIIQLICTDREFFDRLDDRHFYRICYRRIDDNDPVCSDL
jgi:hypothetical protein